MCKIIYRFTRGEKKPVNGALSHNRTLISRFPHHSTFKMAAVTSSTLAMRVVAGSAASGSRRATLSAKPSLARGVATLKSVKMGKASGRGALVVSAVRVSPSPGVAARAVAC